MSSCGCELRGGTVESESRWAVALYKLPLQKDAGASGGLLLDGFAGVGDCEVSL